MSVGVLGPEKCLVRSKSGLRVLPIRDSERSPFELCEPVWIKDDKCNVCQGCKGNFDFIRRKHHCRRCGRIFCNTCSKSKLSLPRMCFLDPVRLCSTCAKITLDENDFYEHDLKILLAGVFLEVRKKSEDQTSKKKNEDQSSYLRYCYLSQSHCNLVLSKEPIGNNSDDGNESEESENIPMLKIKNFENVNSKPNSDTISRLEELKFRVNGNVCSEIHFKVPEKSETSLVSCFLWSLQKALRMTSEARPIIGLG